MDEKNQIELINLVKQFQEVTAVNNVNIKIKKGEFFSLLGPSGCGKTTTLRIIAGLEDATGGKVILNGKDVTNVPTYRRSVNTVFQDYAIFPHMSVYENIYFPLKMRKVSKKQADSKIKRVLEIVNMGGYGHRYSSQLSGGQRQRIALARALVNEPEALLLDEPLGALDFKLRVAMQTALKDIQQELGITFVYVTHDQTEAITMSDRIAVMREGVVHQIGNPDEIYNHPATPFVASFIGEMNFIEGEVTGISDRDIEVRVDGETVTGKKNRYSFKQGDEVLVCVRPERIHINSEQKLPNMIDAKLSRIVFRGDDFEISARFGKNEIQAVIDYKSWDQSKNIGDSLNIGWLSEECKIFPLELEKDIIKYN
jgi:spermidine/putrescine transport system ATP-binding protein